MTGRCGSAGSAYKSSTSSMRATYSPSTCGMHHMSRRHGLRSSSARRRRTVSRDTAAWSVSRTISPASRSEGPALASRRRAGASGRDQQRRLPSRQLARGTRTRFLAEGGLQIAFHEAPLGPIHRRAADRDDPRDLLVTHPGIRRQKDLRALELACRVLAAAQQRRQLGAFGFIEFHPVAYVHRRSPAVEDDDESCRRIGSRVHPEAGSVSGVHRRLHVGQRPPAGTGRYPALLPPHAANRPSDAADAREGPIDCTQTRRGTLHRRSRRTRPTPPPPSRPGSNSQILCDEVLVRFERAAYGLPPGDRQLLADRLELIGTVRQDAHDAPPTDQVAVRLDEEGGADLLVRYRDGPPLAVEC